MTAGNAFIHDSPSGLRVGCEDQDVECLGGGDYEFTYTMDRKNRNKLWKILRSKNMTGTMEEMIKAHFGQKLEKTPFGEFCDENGIKYELFTWIS